MNFYNLEISDLRAIGKALLEMVPLYRFAEGSEDVLKVGAGGDKTFKMDEKAEDIIITHLESLGGAFTVISEEIGKKEINGGGLRILIDPIDGSKNAVTGLPMFCTSIAVLEGDKVGSVVMGYIINLISGDEFWALKGQGAYLNGRPVMTRPGDDVSVILYESQNPGKDLSVLLPLFSLCYRTRCFGATALNLAYLSMGAVSVFVTPSMSRTFDYAAGYLLVKEAGGIVTDIRNQPIEDIEIGVKKSNTILASANESIHKKALTALGVV
ncbi:MAG: inositol monophosphatase [Nitrospirae bacterium]|nr:inositol monophosphatase [Nitrospirota bacterium]MBF0534394.1 inositol monophosphatase [Nitrospirota bacterium]MBF0615625.1 inositol monophosphatase [Nitrospirota bacterium]